MKRLAFCWALSGPLIGLASQQEPDFYNFREFMTKEEHDNFKIIPGVGVPCMGWRKAMNCDPSGPRDPVNDKLCTIPVGGDEAGYCECMDNIHTSAVPCGHRPIKCSVECQKVIKGTSRTYEGAGPDVIDRRITDPGQGPEARAAYYGDAAIHSVEMNRLAINAGIKDVQDKLASMNPGHVWNEADEQGKIIKEAGRQTKVFAKVIRPWIALNQETAKQANNTHLTKEETEAKMAGAALADKIAAKVERVEKVRAPVEDDPEDSFPTDWMSPQNVMKYDIDSDPMTKRIADGQGDAEAQRKLNLQHVSMVQKKRSAYEFLYVDTN